MAFKLLLMVINIRRLMIHFKWSLHTLVLAFALTLSCTAIFAQKNATIVDTTNPSTTTVIAGAEYKKGWLGKKLWGEHYRKVWTMPVNVSKIKLDTTFGGVRPVEKGGGRQTKNLRLDAANKRQYAIRSINKDYGEALPEVAQGTFIETIIKDQMSVAHPYAGATLGALSAAAGVYSTNPKIVFIGDDAKLGKFREEFKNDLYSLEDRPTDDNAKFYGAKDVHDTEDFLEKLRKTSDHYADPEPFIRARLFDMFISDWDRHDDQWKWAEYEQDGKHIYKAIPKDRDQAFSKFDGLLVGMAAGAANLPYLQGFSNDIKDIGGFNFEARPLDMQITNRVTIDTWRNIATSMQQSLTDAAIEKAIKLLPPEVFAVTGEEMISKLKARRDNLVSFAERYYYDLSKNVDIQATEKDDLIKVKGVDDDHVNISLFDLDKNGNPKSQPYYTRTFSSSETDEVRVYGIGGNDKFVADGNTGKKILIRLIGGIEKDSYEASNFSGNIKVYDNPDNTFSSNIRKYISSDTAINHFDRKGTKLNKSGFGPRIGYTNEDRIFVGFGYKMKKQQWRKTPFGYSNDLAVLYSITQKDFRFIYKGVFNEAIGKWNLGLLADYDLVRDAYFMGIGNNTLKFENSARHYHLYKNKELNTGLSVYRTFDSTHTITFTGFYQAVELINEANTFLSQYYFPAHQSQFTSFEQFGGARIEYDFTKINDKIAPNKGIKFHAGAEYTKNLKNSNDIVRFSGLFGFYVPLGPLTLAVKTGAATLAGEPEFYQYNKLGGGPTLRGFARFRFYGKTAFYNQNELQWNFDVKSYLFGGKMGLIALFDNGRVWQPGEKSDKWHTAIGGGIMIAPFNLVSITGTYAVSQEDQRISLRIGHFLKR